MQGEDSEISRSTKKKQLHAVMYSNKSHCQQAVTADSDFLSLCSLLSE